MEIHVKESTIVQPAQETPRHCLWNSNLDLLVRMFHVSTVYFYRRPNDSSNFFDTSVLKEALSNVLVPFYPMAGRMGRDETGRLQIICNAEGFLFIEAETNSIVDDFGDFAPSLKLQQLIPTMDYSLNISSYPLLILQVTRFKCGGICLGVLLHQILADGSSAIHFINAWAGMTRGLPVSIMPFINRTILRDGVPPSPTFHHVEYDQPPSVNPLAQSDKLQSSPESTSTAMIKLSAEQINLLKAKSKKDNVRFSTYEILAAHIWHCVCKARELPDDQASKLYVVTDGRSRLNPPLPPGYLGNVLFTATCTSNSGDVQSKPLIHTVEKIHAAMKRMDDDYLKSALAFLDQQHDVTVLRRGTHTFKCPNLNVVSWIRLPFYDADFGWGRPVFVGPASVIFGGTVYISPSPSNDGSLSLAICLQTHHMQLFKNCLFDF